MSDYERAPDDFESEIDTSDAEVPDHPVIVEVEGHGEASAHLVSEGDIEDYREEYGTEDAEEIGNDLIAAVLRENYISPSFDGLTGEDVSQSKAGYYEPFVSSIAPELMESRGN